MALAGAWHWIYFIYSLLKDFECQHEWNLQENVNGLVDINVDILIFSYHRYLKIGDSIYFNVFYIKVESRMNCNLFTVQIYKLLKFSSVPCFIFYLSFEELGWLKGSQLAERQLGQLIAVIAIPTI